MKSIQGLSSKALLVILDGFGIYPDSPLNAIDKAYKKNIPDLFQNYPYTLIEASGPAVGLPKGICGNSEVGHLNIGAGRSPRQDLVRINEAIADHSLAELPRFKELLEMAKNGSKRIHLLGLLSNGGVHSHIEHIKEVIRILGRESSIEVFFHAFMDGRDTSPTSGLEFVKELQVVPGFHFASMQGRSLGMDRDRRWEKVERGYNTMIGRGTLTDFTPTAYVENQYAQKITDEFISPVLFNTDFAIRGEDSVFFINYRPDRARELTLAFCDPDFVDFPRMVIPKYFLCMTPYVSDEIPHLPVLFDKERIKGGLAEILSEKGLQQFKLAETEKYAHVTYFFNGGEHKPFPGEERSLIPSNKEVSTYDEKPEMSAYLITDTLLKALQNPSYSLYVVNYANSDMVGHTGNFPAAVKAIEVLDECLGRVIQKCEELGITMIVTADHGNSDQMCYADGSPHTSHTESKVPFVVFHPKLRGEKAPEPTFAGALKDVSPTILKILNLEIPAYFDGRPLF